MVHIHWTLYAVACIICWHGGFMLGKRMMVKDGSHNRMLTYYDRDGISRWYMIPVQHVVTDVAMLKANGARCVQVSTVVREVSDD